MTRHDTPIVPDFTPVTPDQLRDHWDTCTECRGPGLPGHPCPIGKDLWDRFVRDIRREAERRDEAQAWDLIHAGWRFEMPRLDAEVMSWYWRSPPRRKGSSGRFHASTNQAWRAMKRAAGADPDGAGRERPT